jgi:hypothetical protein
MILVVPVTVLLQPPLLDTVRLPPTYRLYPFIVIVLLLETAPPNVRFPFIVVSDDRVKVVLPLELRPRYTLFHVIPLGKVRLLSENATVEPVVTTVPDV